MKAFTFFNDPYSDAAYPKDLAKIIEYLEAQGTINTSIMNIEDYYSEFSDNCYCAGWMGLSDGDALSTADEELLERFAEWLSKQEI